MEVMDGSKNKLLEKVENATRHFLLSQYSQSMMVMQDVMKMQITKRSILLLNILDNNITLCRRLMEETSTQKDHQDHQLCKTFEEMMQSLKGVLHSKKTVLVESIIEYNRLVTLLQQSPSYQTEVEAALVERAIAEYLEKVEQTLDKSDISVVLLKNLLTVSQLLAGMVASDWSISAEKKPDPKNTWQPVMQIPSGNRKLRMSTTEGDDELCLTDILDIIKCLDGCQKGAWLQTLKLVKHRRKSWRGILADEMDYVKAYCLYQLSSFEKVKKCLQKLLVRSNLSSSLKVRCHQLSGCCLAEQGKHNLAVQEFRQALASGFKDSLPLGILNLSLLYRKMEATDAELGVLNLLASVSLDDPKTSGGPLLSFTPETVPSLQTSSSELQALYLYHLAHRCFELKRFEEASEKYLELISQLEETPILNLVYNSFLPIQPKPITEIYLEAAISLLQINQFEDAETICDIIISRSRCYRVKGQDSSRSPSQITRKGHSQARDSLESAGPSASSKQKNGETSPPTQRKHFLNSSPDNSETSLTLASAFLVKGECLLKMKNIDNSMESIEDALTVLHEYSPGCREEDNTDSQSEPTAKKRKLESGEAENEQHGPDHNKLRQLKARSYNNKAVILIGQNKLKDALPILLSSLECHLENTDARINYCLLLFKLGRKKEAYREWRLLQDSTH